MIKQAESENEETYINQENDDPNINKMMESIDTITKSSKEENYHGSNHKNDIKQEIQRKNAAKVWQNINANDSNYEYCRCKISSRSCTLCKAVNQN